MSPQSRHPAGIDWGDPEARLALLKRIGPTAHTKTPRHICKPRSSRPWPVMRCTLSPPISDASSPSAARPMLIGHWSRPAPLPGPIRQADP